LFVWCLLAVGFALNTALPVEFVSIDELTLPCVNATDCGSCLMQPNCGWCQGKKCVAGTQSGPNSGTCSSWVYDICPSTQCNYATCGACLEDADCGFCSAGDVCMPGNATQPTEGRCDPKSYFYTSCPGKPGQSAVVELSFPFNGRSDCNICGQYGYYICCTNTYALFNSTMFLDPTPPDSIVNQVKITVTGTWATSTNGYTVDFNMNNSTVVLMPIAVPSNINSGIQCGATCVELSGESGTYHGVPGYVYGGMNFIWWQTCEANLYTCFSEVAITIVYSLPGTGSQSATVPLKFRM